MTPDEQRMIQDLFKRLSSQQGRGDKDAQAERLIADALRSNPDAGYMLVQTALVYEHQMEQQEVRVRELEDQIAQMQQSGVRGGPSAGTGSFLGGRLDANRGSVPASGGGGASPWSSQPQPQPQGNYQQPAYQPQPQGGGMFGGGAPIAQAAPGGGFFRSALQTAAGVAGGMMVANSLSSMFGGGHNAQAGQYHPDNSAALADADQTQDELQDAAYEPQQDDSGSFDTDV